MATKFNTTQQLVNLRNQITMRELELSKITNKRKRTEAYAAFQPEKLELMQQIEKLRFAPVLTGEQPSFQYGKVFMAHKERDKKDGPVIEPIVRYPLLSNVKNDPKIYFMGHEISAYANAKFGKYTWGDFTTNDPEFLKVLLYEGWGEYKCIFANWRDNEGKAILVHRDCPMDSLAEAGIVTKLDNRSQSMKCCKYVNRLFADGDMNHTPRFGKIQEDSIIEGNGWREYIIELDGTGQSLIQRDVFLDDLTEEQVAQVDGHVDLDAVAHSALGLTNNPKLGESWGVTVKGIQFGKGHTRYIPHLNANIVVYGPKKLVGGNEWVFLSLGEKHISNPHTDVQSITNFKLYDLVKKLALDYMRLVYVAAHDAHRLTRMLIKTIRSIDDMEKTYGNIGDRWILRKAIARGISPFAFPGLYRRVIKFLLKNVIDCDTKFRVPMNYEGLSVAISRYASGEPNVITEEGFIDMDRALIAEGCICIPSLPAGIQVIAYRQPNENANAWVKLLNVHIPEYMDIQDKPVCFLGRGVQKVLFRLGGGDMDDNLIIIHNQEWVEHFNTLSYPETDKMTAVEVPAFALYEEELEAVDYSTLNTDTMEHQIDLASQSGLNIGSAVNAGMIDSLLSDPVELASILADLRSRNTDESVDAHNWAKAERIPYTTAFLMTNLELVIDAAVKDPSLMLALSRRANQLNPNPDPQGETGGVQSFIREFHMAQKVYPVCMANRIPQKKKDKGDYILAYTHQCRAMEAIRNYREQLEQKLTRNEYFIMKKADMRLADQLFPPSLRARIRIGGDPQDKDNHPGLRVAWSRLWTEANYAEQLAGERDENKFNNVCDRLDNDILGGFSKEDLTELAVQLYRSLYDRQSTTPVVDPTTFRVRPFFDGLLWTNKLANAFIDRIIETGNAGLVLNVELYAEKHLGQGVHKVKTADGFVYNVDTNQPVGTTHSKLKPGVYEMRDSILYVRECNFAFQPKFEVLDMIEPLYQG